jgi:methyl-accepting chemotaxis protein
MKLKKFNDWKVFYKIVALSIAIIITIFAVFFIFLIPAISDAIYHNKKENVKHTVEVAYNILDNYYKMAKNGVLTEEEAKQKAIEMIRDLRYNENEYFWINDFHPSMIMHPINSSLNGKDLSNNKDPNGTYLFVKMVEVAKREGAGYVEYQWNKPGFSIPSPKISYIKALKEWEWIVGSGIYVDDVEEEIGSIKSQITIILLIASIGAIISGFFIARKISDPIKILNDAATKVAAGNVNVSISIDSKDEIGDLAKAFNAMIEKIGFQIQYLDNIPSPVMVVDKEYNIQYMNKFGASLGNKTPEQVINTKCYNHFKTKDCNTEKCAVARAMRNNKLEYSETDAKPLNTEIPISYTGGPIKDKEGKIIGAIEVVTDLTKAKEYENYLEKNSQKLMVEMNRFAEGDLTVEIIPEKEDDIIGKIFNQFNQVVKNIKAMIISLTDAVQATASASAQISSSAEEMAAGAQEQSTQTTEIAGAVEQMTKTILETSKNAASAAEQAKSAKEVAHAGGKSTEDTIVGMTRISQVVEQAANTIKELGKSSEKIGTIIEVIDDIADQTNLLALNAAIEAARAGEHGRGFAVVADEVRKLAERTTKATKEIGSMIKEIQKDTSGAVMAMESGTSEVEKGMALANESGHSLQEIINTTNGVLDVINQVAAASEEQSSAAEQISHSIEGINSVTQQSAAGVQEIARAAEDLNNLTVTLQRLIDQFKLENSNLGSLAVRTNGKLVRH